MELRAETAWISHTDWARFALAGKTIEFTKIVFFHFVKHTLQVAPELILIGLVTFSDVNPSYFEITGCEQTHMLRRQNFKFAVCAINTIGMLSTWNKNWKTTRYLFTETLDWDAVRLIVMRMWHNATAVQVFIAVHYIDLKHLAWVKHITNTEY